MLGRWYATALLWRPQLALFVHDTTLLPVLMPLAPAAMALDRFPERLAEILELHDVARPVIDHEVAAADPSTRAASAPTENSPPPSPTTRRDRHPPSQRRQRPGEPYQSGLCGPEQLGLVSGFAFIACVQCRSG